MGRDAAEGKEIDFNCIWGDGVKLLVNGKVVSEPLTLPFSLSYIRGDGLFETILGIDEKIQLCQGWQDAIDFAHALTRT